MIVRTIDGQSAAERLEFVRSELSKTESVSTEQLLDFMSRQLFFSGSPDAVAAIELENKGTNLLIHVPRTAKPISWERPPMLAARRLDSGLGYIQFNHWAPELKKPLRNAITEFLDAPGLIIDLRQNVGGDIDFNLEVAGHFLSPKTILGNNIDRDGKASAWLSRSNKPVYKGRIAVLVDEGSLSGSEFFASYVQESGRALIVGRQTAGAVLKQAGEKIHGGGTLHYSTHDFVSIKGQRLQSRGVSPDVVVKWTRADLEEQRDPDILQAERALIDKAGRPHR